MIQYRLLSTPAVHTPGLLAWAMNGYHFEADRPTILHIMTNAFEGIPSEAMNGLLAGKIPFRVEDENIIFEVEE